MDFVYRAKRLQIIDIPVSYTTFSYCSRDETSRHCSKRSPKVGWVGCIHDSSRHTYLTSQWSHLSVKLLRGIWAFILYWQAISADTYSGITKNKLAFHPIEGGRCRSKNTGKLGRNILTVLLISSLFAVLAVLLWVCCITFNIWRAMRGDRAKRLERYVTRFRSLSQRTAE